MDLSFKTSKGHFSLRAAALIVENNCLLIAKHDKFDCFYTVGGGVLQNETTERSVIRELYEETRHHFEIDRLVFIQERFFKIEQEDYHEVVFFYLMKNIGINIVNGVKTDKEEEHLYWVPIEELKKINLVPAFLKTALQDIPSKITHVISYE